MRIWIAVLGGVCLVGCSMPEPVAISDPGATKSSFILMPGDRLHVKVVGSVEATVVPNNDSADDPAPQPRGGRLVPTAVRGAHVRDGARVTSMVTGMLIIYRVPAGPATLHVRVTALKKPPSPWPEKAESAAQDHVFTIM